MPLCVYHSRYGERAMRCMAPCPRFVQRGSNQPFQQSDVNQTDQSTNSSTRQSNNFNNNQQQTIKSEQSENFQQAIQKTRTVVQKSTGRHSMWHISQLTELPFRKQMTLSSRSISSSTQVHASRFYR